MSEKSIPIKGSIVRTDESYDLDNKANAITINKDGSLTANTIILDGVGNVVKINEDAVVIETKDKYELSSNGLVKVETLDSLVEKIEQWAIDRGLDKADPTKQTIKFFEEAGEVASGIARNDDLLIQDGIGDTIVTLAVLSLQRGYSLKDCLEMAYNEIKDRKGKMINGVFVKEEDLEPKLETIAEDAIDK